MEAFLQSGTDSEKSHYSSDKKDLLLTSATKSSTFIPERERFHDAYVMDFKAKLLQCIFFMQSHEDNSESKVKMIIGVSRGATSSLK